MARACGAGPATTPPGNLYVIDMSRFEDLQAPTVNGAPRFTPATITLLIRNGDRFRTVVFDYHGGLRYPRLERIEGTRDRIGDILSPRRR